MDLDGVADELYALTPGEFIAARDAQAKAARAAGDRELAGQIKGLRKPTTVAWIANQLARRHPAEVAGLADLGERLRGAMAAPVGPELRALNVEQRRAIQALADAARELAIAAARPLTEPVVEDLADTLHAALAAPGPAEELARGRLTEGLTPPSFGLVPGPVAAPPAVPRKVELPRADDAHRADEARTGRIDQARMDIEDAEDQTAEARRALIHATAALQRSSARARQAAEHVEQLRAELAEATQSRDRAQQQEDEAHAAQDEADSAVRRAERRLRGAVAALEAAQAEPPAG